MNVLNQNVGSITFPASSSPRRTLVTQPPKVTLFKSHRRHVLGILLVLSVAVVWVASSELIQIIFVGSDSYDKPFFLTYYSVSLFSILLLGFFKQSWKNTLPNTISMKNYFRVREHDISIPEIPLEPLLNNQIPSPNPPILSAHHTFMVSVVLTPIFFLSSWTYNVGLDLTSLSSSATIATLTTLFTFILGFVTGVENFSFPKLFSTILCITGVAIISYADDLSSSGKKDSFMGDAISVLSSFVYAVYTVILKKKFEGRAVMDSNMMLGFLGLLTLLFFWPGVLIMHFSGVETFELPTMKTFWLLTINSVFGTVLTDSLWAMSVQMTTALIATLALSLTVPLSMVLDVFLNSKSFSAFYLLGMVMVLVGFFIVNLYEWRREDDRGEPVEDENGTSVVSNDDLEEDVVVMVNVGKY